MTTTHTQPSRERAAMIAAPPTASQCSAPAADSQTQGAAAQGPVAYIMSRFPKITETFVLYEILAVEQAGRDVEVYPLLREPAPVMHPEAVSVVQRAHFAPFMSWSIACSNLRYLRRKPLSYLKALGELIRGAWGSWNFLFGGLAIFPKVVGFAESMEAKGVTHIHAHFCNHPAAAAYIIHRLTGIPFSFTAHGSDLHRDRRMLREKVSAAEFVVAISDFNRDVIVTECGPSAKGKVRIVHCGVDTNVFRMDRRREADRSRGTLRIVCVGTLHEVKGQTYLLEACHLLQERGVRFECHFVGDGPDRAALVALANRLGISESTHFHGACTRTEVADIVRRADVVATPSVPTADGRREGIPVALMEAMACGIPAVASRLSGIPELVEHEYSGLLTPPGDSNALADALARLADNPELRKRMGAEARKVIEARFDLHGNARLLVKMFSPGCSKSPANPRRIKEGSR